MKVVILYRPKSEHSRDVETFVHNLELGHDAGELQVIDVDSREGTALASLYDIYEYPAILALDDRGSLIKGWEGSSLPLVNDVAFYAQG